MSRKPVDPGSQNFSTFGDLLRYLREKVHLNQRELAGLVGYHYSYISYLEKNVRVPDEASLLGRFVPALGLENEPELVSRLLELAREKQKKPLLSEREVQSPVAGGSSPRQVPASLTS